MSIAMTIADVERDTGLSKDTLRVWERRYGFPRPRRDAVGERSYPLAQVEKLRVIKRLMDAGRRPGGLMSRPIAELHALSGVSRAAPSPPGLREDEVDALLALLRRHDAPGLRRALAVAESRAGLRAFVVDVVGPLNVRVGEAWIRGDLRIFEEHLYTECVMGVLHSALGSLPPAQGRPRVLLATLPGEPHGLGLLMAQTLLTLDDCACLSLGVQVPTADISDAAAAWWADVVALSVTGCMKNNLVRASLAQLRSQLPVGIDLWAGGSAPALARRALDGVTRLANFDSMEEELRQWRTGDPAPAPSAT